MMKLVNKYKKNFSFHLLINTIIALLYGFIFYCEFSTNDDITMARIASGFFGDTNEHLIFISTIIGTFFKKMYNTIPNLDWFELIYYLISIASFSAIGLVFSRSRTKKTVIYYLIIIIVSYSAYCQPQFTKLSSYSAAAGWVCALYSNEFSLKRTIVSSFFLIISFLVRFESFIATSFLWLPVFVFQCTKNGIKKSIKKIIAVILIVISTYCISTVFNNNAYNKTEWAQYNELKSSRALLFDNNLPNYENNIELYENLNINKNCFDLLKNWNFDDKDVIDSNTIIKISQKIDKPNIIELVGRFIYSFIIYSFTKKYMFIYLVIIISLFINQLINKTSNNNLITMSLSFAFMLICIFYVFYKRETIMSRINYGFLFSIMIVFIMLSKYNEHIDLKKLLINFIFIIVLLCYAYGNEIKLMQKEHIVRNNIIIDTLKQFNEDEDNIYLLNVGDEFYNTYCLFDGDNDYCGNIVFLGGWQSCTPIQDEVLKKYGINNPYRDIVNNDNCYIVNTDINLIVRYINDYYEADAYAKYEKSINGFDIYKIVS